MFYATLANGGITCYAVIVLLSDKIINVRCHCHNRAANRVIIILYK